MTTLAGQRSFDDLGTPLHEVTFCVIDLETTGGSPTECGITEIGAVKMRGGECLGTFRTFVNPGQAIPPSITILTGITSSMVEPAPRIETVLPTVLEFIGGSVIVGHNVRFDIGFLDAALLRTGRPRLAHARVDTCALARRLIREEVPDCRLDTLAARFRLPHRPTHRALDDALATADLLHALLERAAGFGVLGLDDLVALPSMGGHPQAAKLRLTSELPRSPGVYLFRDPAGQVLYVGKATDLRSRVRSYFSTDDRRKIGSLLREAHAIDHIVCRSTLEAAVLERRLIRRLLPRFNRTGTRWRQSVYVRLTLNEPYPRLSVVRKVTGGGIHLGPVTSARLAHLIIDAIETAAPLRRCNAPARPGRALRASPCAPAQLGCTTCPCTGTVPVEVYGAVVQRVVRGLTVEPMLLLEPLQQRIGDLAHAERFEEAADVRDRAAALAEALFRQQRLERLQRAGRVVMEVGTLQVELDGGRLLRSWAEGELPLDEGTISPPEPPARTRLPIADAEPLEPELADEVACVAGWLDANIGRVRLVSCDGVLASPVTVLPRFVPGTRL